MIYSWHHQNIIFLTLFIISKIFYIKSTADTTNNNYVTKKTKHFPLVEEESGINMDGVLLRVYDNKLQSSFKLNDKIEIYGILEHARLCNTIDENTHDDSFEKCSDPLPRVHAIVVNHLNHNNPLLSASQGCIQSLDDDVTLQSGLQSSYHHLSKMLLDLLGNDNLATQYLLMHLISNRFIGESQYPNSLPALNIYHFNLSSTDTQSNSARVIKLTNNLAQLLPRLVTQFASVQLSIQSLNDGPCLMPIRDSNKGHLNSGRLQLAQGTHVFINETDIDAGQLNPRGLINFQALNSLAVNQKVPYDFQFYTQEWETDVRVLILSILPSLIKPVLSLPWRPTSEYEESVNFDLIDNQIWNEIRKFVTLVSHSQMKYCLNPELQEHINRDFVQWRQNKSTFINAEDFAVMLCLLRFYCLVRGSSSPTIEDWKTITEFERERNSRIQLLKTRVN